MWVLVEPLVATSTNTTLLKDAVAVALVVLSLDPTPITTLPD